MRWWAFESKYPIAKIPPTKTPHIIIGPDLVMILILSKLHKNLPRFGTLFVKM